MYQKQEITKVDLKIFLFFIFITILFHAYFAFTGRIPVGDTLNYAILQYNLFNDLVMKDAYIDWFPFMSHGFPANPWVFAGFSFTTPIWAALSYIFPSINSIVYFYGLIAFHELVFACGMFLLCKLFFKERITIVFVVSSALLSIIATRQIFFSLQIFSYIPLIIYYVLTGLEKKSSVRILFSGFLGLFSLIGSLAYYIPINLMVMIITAFIWIVYNFRSITKHSYQKIIKPFGLDFKKHLLINFLLVIVSTLILFIVYASYNYGASEIAYLPFEGIRTSSIKNSLSMFLTYAGRIDFFKYYEFLSGISPDREHTFFGGYLVSFLAIITLLNGRQFLKRFDFWLWTAFSFIFFFFSTGTFVSRVSYYLFPFMDYFRHIGFTTGLLKMFLILLAGIGFEQILMTGGLRRKHTALTLLFFLFASYVSIIFIMFFSESAFHPGILRKYFASFKILPSDFSTFYLASVSSLAFIILFSIILIFISFVKNKKKLQAAVYALLALHVLSLIQYKYFNTKIATFDGKKTNSIQLFQYYDYKFQNSRTMRYDLNPRYTLLKDHLYFNTPPDYSLPTDATIRLGGIYIFGPIASSYVTLDSLFYFDPCMTSFRVDRQVKYVNKYFIDNGFFKTMKYMGQDMGFPDPIPDSFLKSTACEFDKIRFYSSASIESSDNKDTLKKDSLVLQVHPDQVETGATHVNEFDSENKKLIYNKKIDEAKTDFSYEVTFFSSNALELKISGGTGAGFLYYSDAWHPYWSAAVDGKDVPVFRTNSGFKAVPIRKNSTVRFEFRNIILTILHYALFGVCGAFLVLIFVKFRRIMRIHFIKN